MDKESYREIIATRQALNILIRRLSYREGNFTLASGKQSSFYIDLKNTTLHPEGIAIISKLAVDRVEEMNWMVDAVGGLTLGADPLATGISLEAWKRGIYWPAVLIRKEAKGHGTGRYLEGARNLVPGARILVLEDVITTGGSSLAAIERIREAGFNTAGALAVVDRGEGGRAALEAVGVKLESLTTLENVQEVPNPRP